MIHIESYCTLMLRAVTFASKVTISVMEKIHSCNISQPKSSACFLLIFATHLENFVLSCFSI